MRTSPRMLTTLAALSAALMLGLAACSDSNPTGAGGTPALSQAQADSVGETVANDAGELIETSGFDASTGVSLSVPTGPSANSFTPPCQPSITPPSPANSDADPIPDSVRVDFAGCSFTRMGIYTHTLSGLIDVIDPTPQNTDIALKLVFTDFTKARTNSLLQKTVSAVYNGSREIAATPDTLGHSITNFQTVYTFANGRTATHLKTWVAKFTATTPGTILEGSPLPAGDWSINGSSSWTRGNGGTFDLQVSTPVVLHHDPTCLVEPRFTSGTLQAVVTQNSSTSTVTIQFTGCGTYTVTRS